MKDKNVWQLIYDCLHKDIPVVLLIVVESDGSTPGRVGFKMAVTEEGTLLGTIGGGAIEHRFVNQAEMKLKNQDFFALCQRQIHHQQATTNRSGMICGGMQTVVIYPCQPQKDLITIKRLTQAIDNQEQGILKISPSGISFTSHQQNAANYQFKFQAENEWQYEENVGLISTAYIIGGGHVGLALSRILAMLDFYIVVLDERAEINTFQNNTDANEKLITAFHQIEQHIPDGEQNYVFIMTPNHRADEVVLRQLLAKKLGYLGMMGSASKVDEIIQHLQKDGISSEQLQCLHAPIGLPIRSHTPTEIAISIAAEIISIKNS
ncbi:MAG: XdhC/CoxI family protein [Candidatus Parabeggiatoa sp. nov. 1]|nr:MAG: XdhC/CoxI family protein [Gammaproteobacteria bacterium]